MRQNYGPLVKGVTSEFLESHTIFTHQQDPSSTNTRLTKKPKSKNSAEKTPYYCKLYPKDTSPNIIIMEAVLADLSRRVFSLNFTAKNRVNVPPNQTPSTKIHLLSRAMEFIPAQKLSIESGKYLIEKNQKDIAKLTISMFAFANPDLHGFNWGVDPSGNIVMIDFDKALPFYSEKFHSERLKITSIIDESLLEGYPNLIYDADELFKIISADDVQQLPMLSDAKPYNHPFSHTIKGRSYADALKIASNFSSLNQDAEYKKWLYYYAIKFFMLTNDNHLQTIINDHSTGDKQADNALLNAIKTHRNKVYAAFLQVKEYRDFVQNLENDSSLYSFKDELVREIAESNLEFSDKNGNPKPQKAYRRLNILTIFNSLKMLKSESESYEKNLTPKKSNELKIKLYIDRIIQKFSISNKLHCAINAETTKKDGLLKIFNASKKRHEDKICTLHHTQKNSFLCFLNMYHIPLSEEIDPNSLCNANIKLKDYFSKLNDHIAQHEKYLSEWRNNNERLMANEIKELFESCVTDLTTSDIKQLWTEAKEKKSIHLDDITYRIFSTMEFSKIPPEIYEYLCATSSSCQNSKFEKFSILISGLETAKKPPHSLSLWQKPDITSIVSTKLLDSIKNPTKQIMFTIEELETAIILLKKINSQSTQKTIVNFTTINDHLSEALKNKGNDQQFFTIKLNKITPDLELFCELLSPKQNNVARSGIFATHATVQPTTHQDTEKMPML